MDELYIYILKVNVAIVVFYFLYRILFNRDTFIEVRRIFLLTVLFLSFVYPFITLSSWLENREPLQVVMIDYADFFVVTATPETAAEPFVTLENVLWSVYLCGLSFFIFRITFQFVSLLRMMVRGKRVEWNGKQIIALSEKTAPFSFFGWIFVNPALHEAKELEEIFIHEHTHVRQGHSWDMLAGEVLCVFFWFNPAAWLVRYEIRQNLEFLADKNVIKSGYDPRNYQYHLLRLSYQSVATQIVNNFNVSQLKKRIIMMNKKRTSRLGLIKYALLLPVTGLLVLSGSTQAIARVAREAIVEYVEEVPVVEYGQVSVVKGQVVDEKGKPIPGVTVIIQGTNVGVVSDAKGNFNLTEKESGVLVFSYVGKKTQRIPFEAGQKDLKVVMSTEATELDQVVVMGMMAEENQKVRKDAEVFVAVEEMPRFADGKMQFFLAKNMIYPNTAAKNGIQGTVYVSFVIDKNGKVTNPAIQKSVDESLDKEALRVVGLMPDWIPGKQRGQAVEVLYTLPIVFQLMKPSDIKVKTDNVYIKAKTGGENDIKTVRVMGEKMVGNAITVSDDKIQFNNAEMSKALIIIDGKEMPLGSDCGEIEMSEVESISVLQEASSVLVYGKKAKYGAIIITMKKKK